MKKSKTTYLKEKRQLETRIAWMFKNKVQYFQPTISPAPKHNGVIESVEGALEYYKPFTDKVIVQKKHMGSYCLMYLNRDHSKSYFQSRNGYIIDHIEGLHGASVEIHDVLFAEHNSTVEWLLVEAELMTWKTMGSGLIEREYGNYARLHKERITYLSSSGVYEKINKLKEQNVWEKDGLKQHEQRQYNSVRDINTDLATYQSSWDLYQRQYEIFGLKEGLYFEPFSVLKTIKKDGTHTVGSSNAAMMRTLGSLSSTDAKLFDVSDTEGIQRYFDAIKTDEHEGIMIKPLNRIVGIAPTLKVRTKAYLQLIYGLNFDRDYEYYYEKRNVKWKTRTSTAMYEIAMMMLHTPLSQIKPTNKRYEQLLYKVVGEENYLKTLDNRL